MTEEEYRKFIFGESPTSRSIKKRRAIRDRSPAELFQIAGDIAAELISQSTPEEISSLKEALIDEIYWGREDPSIIEEEIDAAIQRPSSRIPTEDDKLDAEAWLFAINVGMPTIKLLQR